MTYEEYKKKYEMPAYTPSDRVNQAQAALDQHQQQKPGEYTSQWADQRDQLLGQIQNREPFRYDINEDALYNQYKDQYIRGGKLAMMDTMGQSAALTGGYGSSYAQQVGQQAYQGYLQGLNDKVPQLYQQALDQYNRQGDELYRQYGMLGDRESEEYGRYQDALNAWLNDRNYLSGRLDSEQAFDYGTHRDQVADKQWQIGSEEELDKLLYQHPDFFQKLDSAINPVASTGGGGSWNPAPAAPTTPVQPDPKVTAKNLADMIAKGILPASSVVGNAFKTLYGNLTTKK